MKRNYPFVLVTKEGRCVRKAEGYKPFGNKKVLIFRLKGQRYMALPKNYEGGDMTESVLTGIASLPHVFHPLNSCKMPAKAKKAAA